ncbi:LAFE_0E04676g1_1 [Lachancea fermentati]|uniref:Pre-mRNA-splicing factor SLT11 n=1 Tax=Lachancea fermentati TaxID=4955 RepID=A0A1G4MCT5_LACFM|nr:LAFE_0E04676g1_1 [Lachancea fermentati]
MNQPAICETCLGDQDRLTRAANGAQCKICTLPFDVYHFKSHGAVAKTVICLNCSKQRNICQCCLLDLQWHIPVEVRDRVLSIVQGSDVATSEAHNDMMKRFIALKDGDSFKLGGAKVTSDAEATAAVLSQIRSILDNANPSQPAKALPDSATASSQTESAANKANFPDVDVSHLLKRLPIKASLEPAPAFFLYNIDPSVPEWAIMDKVAELVGTANWHDTHSTAVAINHAARCGGIRFKSTDLGHKFAETVPRFTTPSGTVKGVMQLRNSRIHIVAWPQFNRAAMGDKYAECRKLGLCLDQIVQKDLSTPSKAPSKSKKQGKVAKQSIGLLKNKKRKRRVLDIEL